MKLTIRNKLTALGVLVVLSMALVAIIGGISVEHTVDLQKTEAEVGDVAEGMLLLRRREKDFLMRNDLSYRDKFNADYLVLAEHVSQVRNKLEAHGLDTGIPDAAAESFAKYRDSFLKLVRVQQRIGLHPKDGLYGSLRAAVHAVEKPLAQMGEDTLSKDMLMLRRREKDFMLRDDLKYVEKFEKDFLVMTSDLAASDLSYGDKSSLQKLLDQYRNDFLALVEGHKEKGLSEKEGLRGEMRRAVHSAEQQIDTMKADVIAALEEEVRADRTLMMSIIVVLAIIMAGVIIVIARSIIRPVESLRAVMQDASNHKDLSLRAPVSGNDEIAEMAAVYNTMSEAFHGILKRVQASSIQVSSSAGELAVLTNQSRQGMLRQQGESQQAASAMNKMTATVQEVARNASNAANASRTADEEASKGRNVVNQAISGIQKLAEEVENTSHAIRNLEKESDSIGTVLNVIQGIAEQTNLLALNAAIEAARAGESGRGFAVVADEVRTLAQRSQESTEEIKSIIERLQSGAQLAVKAMEQGRDQTQETVQQAEAAKVSLGTIAEAVAAINGMNIQIAGAAEEQSVVAEEISHNVVNIAQVSEETAAATESITQTSAALATLSDELQHLIAQFRLEGGGAGIDSGFDRL
jgi:methyl-accepting chemotaxis protein